MKSFKADRKANLYFIFGSLFLFGFALPLFSKEFTIGSWLFFLAFWILLLLYNLFLSAISEVVIDIKHQQLQLVYKNYFKTRKIVEYPLSKIKFAYKRQATSFRGGIKNVCSLYHDDLRIAQLIPDEDGWEDDEIWALVHQLLEEGVEKKFIGYTLKDVEIKPKIN